MKKVMGMMVLMMSMGVAHAEQLKLSAMLNGKTEGQKMTRQDFSFGNEKYSQVIANLLNNAKANGVQNIGFEARGNKTGVSVVFSESVEYLSCKEFYVDKASVVIDLNQNKTLLSFGDVIPSPAETVANLSDCLTNMNLSVLLTNKVKEQKLKEWAEFGK